MTSASRTSRGETSECRVFTGGTFSVIASRARRKHDVHLASEGGEAKGGENAGRTFNDDLIFRSSRKQSIPTTAVAASAPEPLRQNAKSNADCFYLRALLPSCRPANDKLDDCTVLSSLVASAVIITVL